MKPQDIIEGFLWATLAGIMVVWFIIALDITGAFK